MRRNQKTQSALGETPAEVLSDMGSIPITSTIRKKRGFMPLFLRMAEMEESDPYGLGDLHPVRFMSA